MTMIMVMTIKIVTKLLREVELHSRGANGLLASLFEQSFLGWNEWRYNVCRRVAFCRQFRSERIFNEVCYVRGGVADQLKFLP